MDEEIKERFNTVDNRFNSVDKRFDAVEKRLGVLEADVAVIRSNYVTKADLSDEVGKLRNDISKLESTMLKWFMATALSITALTFTIAKFTS